MLALAATALADATVFYVGTGQSPLGQRQKAEVAAEFYGLSLVALDADSLEALLMHAQSPGTGPQAWVISSQVLRHPSGPPLRNALIDSQRGPRDPILLIGLDGAASGVPIQAWTRGVVRGMRSSAGLSAADRLEFAESEPAAAELAGIAIPAWGGVSRRGWALDAGLRAEAVISRRIVSGGIASAMVRVAWSDGEPLYASSDIFPALFDGEPQDDYRQERFPALAPVLLFLRASFGRHAWHAPDDFANLTIDDPWLIEPYGAMSWNGLVRQMLEEPFHTTIAFVPWNHDRGDSNVIRLVLSNPDLLSLSVHGSDHYHREFGGPEDRERARENAFYDLHERKIQTAIARMNALSKRTALPYDRVMVFPHGVSFRQTFELLRRYNFLATTNSRNIPIDGARDFSSRGLLRSTTVRFANFASVKRFPATANPQLNDSARIAIDLFLDNPVIRYTHHPFFSDGQDAFNAMARIINQTQPRVRWASLGTISRHLYQIRRATSPQIDYEIEGFSREVVIRNPDSLLRRFRFWRQETAARGDFDVHIGDEPLPYRLRNDRLTLEFALGPYQQCTLSIQYPPPVQIDTVAFDKGGIRIQLTRYLSDFRDVVLGRTRIGTRLARTYYDRGGGGGRLKLAAALGAILLAGAGFLTWRFGFGNKRR